MTPTDATRPAPGPGPDSGHTDAPDAREGLRGLLGDRYEATRRAALKALLTAELHAEPDEGLIDLLINCGPRSDYVLAGVLPDLLAEAWDEGKYSDHTPECRFGDGDCICPNPYRTEGTNS